MKFKLIGFFAWIVIMGSIVYELKFTDHAPDGRQIIALVAFTILLATQPEILFESDKAQAIFLSVLAAIGLITAIY